MDACTFYKEDDTRRIWGVHEGKMIPDELRQKLIVRQSCMKNAIDLLNNEQTRCKSDAAIPKEAIFKLTKELESFVFSVNAESKPKKLL